VRIFASSLCIFASQQNTMTQERIILGIDPGTTIMGFAHPRGQ
jgi:predicted RNase H-like nuclease (RuvC/YqgF family)